jgi:hypothetical protein
MLGMALARLWKNSRQRYWEIREEAKCERAYARNDRGCGDKVSLDAYWYE